MTRQSDHSGYFDDLDRRNWITWTWSGLAAIGLNLVLFLLMPHLMDPAPLRSSYETVVPRVNVIRIKRHETKIKRKTVKPPEKPRQKPDKHPQATLKHPISTKLRLPFKLNPRLPGGPGTLALPPFTSSALMNITAPPNIFSVEQLDAPLTALARIPPVYPLRARRRGIEGWVKVQFVVNNNGRVDNITIIEAHPAGLFEQSVERCVSAWRFKPGTVDGMIVKTRVETTIRFALD
ncbi:MAG: energy transducer TonB [Deltaproteobacteria bacterium]|nr:energy transducer TonB [Candidatus Tharpellaceae bacterium]